jgi:hypothetical protein
MRRNLPLRIGVAAVLLVLALTGMVAREGYARATGVEAVLATAPVDPRNLLTGHYVALNLVDELPPGVACPKSPIEGESWIALRPHEGRHRVVGAGPTREAALRTGGLAVRGTVICQNPQPDRIGPSVLGPPSATLEIGVTRFHADQTEALAIEDVVGDRAAAGPPRTFAIVSVGTDGRARLKGMLIDGRRVELDWF